MCILYTSSQLSVCSLSSDLGKLICTVTNLSMEFTCFSSNLIALFCLLIASFPGSSLVGASLLTSSSYMTHQIHKTLHVSHVIYFHVHSLSQSSHNIDSHNEVAVYCTTLTQCAAKERDMPEVGDPMFAWCATSRGLVQ